MSVELPNFSDYMRVVEGMINKNELTVEQGIILRCCYNATVNERPVNVNYLMSATGLNWKRISAILNGLVLKGAIRVHDKKWYTL
jgi:predicted Rossmann fold nucleotide-binding protein DprA/Smf involved in DNA uptake|tara:strand:- start:334 stop:588 length:255 start_codon:yes stop_codon:yes gene_type:complete